jgi:translation initiation factor eIF-2B subunit delta
LEATVKMPSSDPPPTGDSSQPEITSPTPTTSQSQSKGESKKGGKPQETTSTGDGPKLSGAELKKQKQAEKAARRAQQKQTVPAAPVTAASGGQLLKADGAKGAKGQHKRGGSVAVELRNMPLRGAQKSTPVPDEPKKEDKTVEFFRHLYKTRTTSIAGVSKEVHPAVLALGLQMSNYTICGSCARLVATLQAFKRVSGFYAYIAIELTSAGHRVLHNSTYELTYTPSYITCSVTAN